VVEPIPSGADEPRARRPVLGYAMVLAATAMWGINGTVSKGILDAGLSSSRLTEVRSTGAALALGLALLLTQPWRLRVRRGELLFLAGFGIFGLALVQWLYFFSIHRLKIGIALLIQYLAPVLIALWARFVTKERVRRRIWVALILSLAGLSLVVELWDGFSLDTLGTVAALGAAVAFAFYILLAEHAVGLRDPVSLLCLGFAVAALFWAVVQPWWSFPAGIVDERVRLDGALIATTTPVWALMLTMIAVGTILPFLLLVGALRHISATRVAVTAMFEPVAGALVAYAWLGEELSAVQVTGGAIVLGGIVLAQTAR
jgi:drug/metabolite transporter (DMT)-like permease